MKLQEKLQ